MTKNQTLNPKPSTLNHPSTIASGPGAICLLWGPSSRTCRALAGRCVRPLHTTARASTPTQVCTHVCTESERTYTHTRGHTHTHTHTATLVPYVGAGQLSGLYPRRRRLGCSRRLVCMHAGIYIHKQHTHTHTHNTHTMPAEQALRGCLSGLPRIHVPRPMSSLSTRSCRE